MGSPGALGVAGPETAVRLGGGWMGEKLEKMCVGWGWGSRSWKLISLPFFSPSFPGRAGIWGGRDLEAQEKGDDWRAGRRQPPAEDC